MRKSKGNKRVLKKRRAKKADTSAASSGVGRGGGSSATDTIMQNHQQPQRKRFAVTTKKRSGDGIANSALRAAAGGQRKSSMLLKKQAQERMVLKEHMQELKKRKMATVKGQDAKTERRQMAKYMKALRKQQISKHAGEISNLQVDQKQEAILTGNASGRAGSSTTMSRRKQLRYLNAPVTVGLPHGRSAAIPITATPLPSNATRSVSMMVDTSTGANSVVQSNFMGRQERQRLVKAGQQNAQQRWKVARGCGDDDDTDDHYADDNNNNNEWLDEDEGDFSSGQQNNYNGSRGAKGSNATNLQQLFSGFGSM